MTDINLSKSTTLDGFLEIITSIDWFSCIGKDLDYPYRISSWDEWVGPEDPSCSPIGLMMQEIHDALFDVSAAKNIQIKPIWEEIHSSIHLEAVKHIPYDEKEDAWYAPNTAAWQASWIGALIYLSTILEQKVHDDIAAQWNWFSSGNWPCSYALKSNHDRELFQHWYSEGGPAEGFAKHFSNNKYDFVVY